MNTPDDPTRAFEDLLAMLPPESREAMLKIMASARPRPGSDSISQAELGRLEEGDCEIAVVPKANAPKKPIEGLTVHAVERIEEAIEVVRGL